MGYIKKMSSVFLKSNTFEDISDTGTSDATLSLPQWITVVDNNAKQTESASKAQVGGQLFSPTSSFNDFDLKNISATSSFNMQQGGGKSNIQDINKLVSMLTSESDTISDMPANLDDFDTVTSITSTSVLESKLRNLFNNQQEGGAKKKRKASKKGVDVEEKKGKKKSKKASKAKKSKKASKKASKAKKGSKKSKKASKKAS